MHFLRERMMEFDESDTGWRKRQSLEEQQEHDYMRQWYALTDEEATEMMKAWAAGKFDETDFAKIRPVDTSEMTPYMKKNLDFVHGLDLIQNRGERGKQVNTDTAAKAFRYDAMRYLFQSGREGTSSDRKTIAQGAGGLVPGPDWEPGGDAIHGDWSDDWKPWHQGLDEWRNIEKPGGYLTRQIENLYRVRDLAAKEAGVSPEFFIMGDLPPAKNAAELRQQYDDIDAMGITQLQKDFLQQKSATRWIMQQCSDMGYTRLISDNMHGSTGDGKIKNSAGGYDTAYGYLPPDKGKNTYLHASTDEPRGEQDPLEFLNDSALHQGVPPWVNRGEEAIPEWVKLTPGRRDLENGSNAAIQQILDAYEMNFGTTPEDQIEYASAVVNVAEKTGKQYRQTKARIDRTKIPKPSRKDEIRFTLANAAAKSGKQYRQTKARIDRTKKPSRKDEIRQARASAPDQPTWERDDEDDPLSEINTGEKTGKGARRGTTRRRTDQYKAMLNYRKEALYETWARIRGTNLAKIKQRGQRKQDEIDARARGKILKAEERARVAAQKHDVTAYHELQHPTLSDEVTYEKFLQAAQTGETAVLDLLHEPSLPHVYESLLRGEYSWAPSNVELNNQNLPPSLVRGKESHFQPTLNALPIDLRKRADHLHDLVHKPETKSYLQKYHPDTTVAEFEKHASIDIRDDWGIPFKKGLHQVKADGVIHRQMDFGGEDA